jgi:hypothetical protein
LYRKRKRRVIAREQREREKERKRAEKIDLHKEEIKDGETEKFGSYISVAKTSNTTLWPPSDNSE